jgi:hypothetical protein
VRRSFVRIALEVAVGLAILKWYAYLFASRGDLEPYRHGQAIEAAATIDGPAVYGLRSLAAAVTGEVGSSRQAEAEAPRATRKRLTLDEALSYGPRGWTTEACEAIQTAENNGITTRANPGVEVLRTVPPPCEASDLRATRIVRTHRGSSPRQILGRWASPHAEPPRPSPSPKVSLDYPDGQNSPSSTANWRMGRCADGCRSPRF